MKIEELKILEVINKGQPVHATDIARLSAIPVGKVRYLLNYLLEKQWVYRQKMGKYRFYYATDLGVEYLKDNLEQLRETRISIHHEEKRVRQAVLLAADLRKDLGSPAGLLPLGDTTLFSRNVELLKRNGIEQIILVTGYQKHLFAEVVQDSIHIVENSKYKWTGTMASLACAAPYITDDFLLFASDILIEEQAIIRLLQNKQRDCILITNESGSGDEAFVEIKNDYIHKISKDIHQLNKIDGEMLGISKISFELLTKMMEEYTHNRNPYLNYEYLLLDVAKRYTVGHLKLSEVVWADIRTKEQYAKIVNYLYPRLKRKEAEFQKQEMRPILREAIALAEEEDFTVEPFGGMTNKNFKITVGTKEYVLRIPGNGTEQMINRHDEKVNALLASEIGIDTEVAYFNEHTGVKVSEMIPYAETLTGKTARRESFMALTTNLLRTLHATPLQMNNRFDVFEKIEMYEGILRENHGRNFEDYEDVRAQVMKMRRVYEAMDVPIVPCHNDTVPENFIKSGEDTIYLIDWEYSGMNDPMWDIAAHMLECDFSEEEEELFLQFYLGKEASAEVTLRVLINKILQDFLWSIWANIKEAEGDDFGSYGMDRYNRAKRNIQLFFALVGNGD